MHRPAVGGHLHPHLPRWHLQPRRTGWAGRNECFLGHGCQLLHHRIRGSRLYRVGLGAAVALPAAAAPAPALLAVLLLPARQPGSLVHRSLVGKGEGDAKACLWVLPLLQQLLQEGAVRQPRCLLHTYHAKLWAETKCEGACFGAPVTAILQSQELPCV